MRGRDERRQWWRSNRPLYISRTGHSLKQMLSALNLQRRRSGEVCAMPNLTTGGVNHRRESMAERNSSQSHSVFNEFVAIDIPDTATEPLINKTRGQDGILIIALRIRMRPARYQGVCARTECIGK
jgi:hypothetical protein